MYSIWQKTGQTALHYAVAKNFLASVQILIFSGADTTIKDKVERERERERERE